MPPRIATLLTSLTFIVLSITGVLAFVRTFSIQIVGLHALMGFVFVALVGFHIFNNFWSLKQHLASRVLWACLSLTILLTVLFWWQPTPIKKLLSLSGNLGPALDRFELSDEGMAYQYSPSPNYKMSLDVRTGGSYDVQDPPFLAIWLENQSLYHIKTLFVTEREGHRTHLPYWAFKVAGWEKAKQDAAQNGTTLEDQVDGISSATQNSSFEPSDYILPGKTEESMPYQVMIEINDPTDKLRQPASLIYKVEVDNFDPRTFQLLDLVGHPVKGTNDTGEVEWAMYYIDERFDAALELIDSALLRIDRK